MKIEKKILKVTIIVVFIIAILVVLLIYSKNAKKHNEMQEKNKEEFLIDTNELREIDDINEYINVSQSIDRYFNYIKADNKKSLLQLLDEDYVKEFNITENNVYTYSFERLNEKIIYFITGMKYKYYSNMIEYVVSCRLLNNDQEENIFLVLIYDRQNSSFSVLPQSKNYNSIGDIKLKENLKSIEKKDSNGYINNSISNEQMCKYLLEDYIKKAVYFPKEAYNSLDEEYRNKRFENYEGFIKYINDNRKNLEVSIFENLKPYTEFKTQDEYTQYIKGLDRIELYKYLVDTSGSGKNYVCLDRFNNYYVFNLKGIINYSLTLDTYTIMSDKFKKEYTEGNDTKKCQLNIDKFFKMINNKDYTHAYEVLDEGFKNNYFKSQDDFEKFVSSHFYEFNNIKFNSASYEGNVYIFKLTVTNVKNSNNSFEMNIFMKLKDSMDFVMSFGKA